MTKFLLLIICGVWCQQLQAKPDKIEVAVITKQLMAGETHIFYYAFADKDDIYISFRQKEGRGVVLINLIEYPATVRYSFSSKNSEKAYIKDVKKGIYQFSVTNTAKQSCVIAIDIDRRPDTDYKRNFNSSVAFQTKYDTNYATRQEAFVIKQDTIATMVTDRVTRVHSRTTLDREESYEVVTIILPNNTKIFSYYIGVGEAGKKAYKEAVQKFVHSASKAATVIPEIGPLVSLAIEGVNFFTMSSGSDNVRYAMFESEAELKKYIEPGTEKLPIPMKDGNIVSDQGRVTNAKKSNYYLYLKNDNIRDAIDVQVKIVAIQIVTQMGTRTVREAVVTKTITPYMIDAK
ncbi:MAG: hypothetical protein SGJ04_00285 [Bacteroidota bacterium]|nr:hypothetical protein [Bacteroidota bacterium]